ncbi:MAG: 5-oxoprolinase subunit PxpB [Lactobacillus sp.]|jgi:KipI family sensor histidine kinase inhibitor|nr:5-oxoprolinase subunit PxpB [Lactobacillus sp.]
MNAYHYHYVPMGESALDLVLPNKIDVGQNQLIQTVGQQLLAQKIAGVTAIIPAYHTLTVNFVASLVTYGQLTQVLDRLIGDFDPQQAAANSRVLAIPVCYDPEFGPDLAAVAAYGHLSVGDLIQMHTQTKYFIYMMGFLPGFAYMGTVPKQIAMPRLDKPRARLEPGSVGIAGAQTGMYPVASPGGWRLLGRTPLQLFNAQHPQLRYQAGDYIQFTPISKSDYQRIQALDLAGQYQIKQTILGDG